jgi:hypothetical protein
LQFIVCEIQAVCLSVQVVTILFFELCRSKHCDVIINPNILDGTANTISRRHISIDRCKDGIYEFHDLGALNGTFLNDKKAISGILNHGDTIQLGGGAGLKDGEVLATKEAGVCFTFLMLKATPINDPQQKASRSHKKRALSPQSNNSKSNSVRSTPPAPLKESLPSLKDLQQHANSFASPRQDGFDCVNSLNVNGEAKKEHIVSKMSSLTSKLEGKKSRTSDVESPLLWRSKSPSRISLVNGDAKSPAALVSAHTPEKSILRVVKCDNRDSVSSSSSRTQRASVKFVEGTKSPESPDKTIINLNECASVKERDAFKIPMVSISCQTSLDETVSSSCQTEEVAVCTSFSQTSLIQTNTIDTQTDESSLHKSLLSTVPTSTAMVTFSFMFK